MSTTPTAIPREHTKVLPRLRGFIGAALFLAMRRFPRLLQLHRNESSWTLFRVALACFGAALVVLPLSLWNGWFTAIFGLALFVVAVLLPPAELESSTDRKARELGAQTVVSGGEYQPGNAPLAPVRLFISPEHVWALDGHFHPLVVIPVTEITRLAAGARTERLDAAGSLGRQQGGVQLQRRFCRALCASGGRIHPRGKSFGHARGSKTQGGGGVETRAFLEYCVASGVSGVSN